MSTFAHVVEWVSIVTLILGVATRYGALLAFAFVVIAFVIRAPLLAISGGGAKPAIHISSARTSPSPAARSALFVTGGGRISVDAMLAGKG